MITDDYLILQDEDINQLAGFFDLLAKFDFEDNHEVRSATNSTSLVSAPREVELGADLHQE